MDFLDDAVNKAREAFDIARQKTNEVVQTGKQKFDIASIENKLNKDYTQLGKLYFDTLKDSEIEDEEVNTLVCGIKEKMHKIAVLKEEMNTTKNKRTCSNCGAEVDFISVYCNICGERLEK